ncbi:MAG: hypothetical protein IPL61_36235 [Myxococcales bacterium]|nr:hypothetical protein [Myxococcales bacterium]
MDLALVIAIAAVATGVMAAVVADARLWVLAPVRAFAVMAVALAIAVHILPEAIDGGGWGVLIVAAVGLVAPIALGRATATLGARHRRMAAELGYVAVLVHQLSDGLALGAATGGAAGGVRHWDLLIGVGAHTVPLIAMLTLTFAELGGRRSAIVRAVGLLAATIVGILLTRLDGSVLPSAEPWLNAAVSGLLLHVLVHDSGDREVPAATRPLEAVGVAMGAALPFLTGGHEHGPLTHALRENLATIVVGASPWIVAGGALAVITAPAYRRSPRAMISTVTGPLTALGLVVAAYAATGLTNVDGIGSVGAALIDAATVVPRPIALVAAILLAAVALAQIARVGLLTWLGTSHAHDHGPARAHDHAAHDHAAHGHAAHGHAARDHAAHDHAARDHAAHDHDA